MSDITPCLEPGAFNKASLKALRFLPEAGGRQGFEIFFKTQAETTLLLAIVKIK